MSITVTGKAYSQETRDWTEVATYEARDLQDARNWMKFNRDWMKDLKIVDETDWDAECDKQDARCAGEL